MRGHASIQTVRIDPESAGVSSRLRLKSCAIYGRLEGRSDCLLQVPEYVFCNLHNEPAFAFIPAAGSAAALEWTPPRLPGRRSMRDQRVPDRGRVGESGGCGFVWQDIECSQVLRHDVFSLTFCQLAESPIRIS
jgi:hypothetical protein